MKGVAALFVCVHNSGRSQMAKAFFNHFAAARGIAARADSSGTHPAARVNPTVTRVLADYGLAADERPKLLTDEMALLAERVITMGCSVEPSLCPSVRFDEVEDWGLPDPQGRPIDEVRALAEVIRGRVNSLLDCIEGDGR